MKEERPIELRSEKVRNIIGRMPSALIRYGTMIIGAALLMLCVVSAFIPYRETVPVPITIQQTDTGLQGVALVPKDRLPLVHSGSKVTIDDPLAGFIEATVSGTSKKPAPADGRQREVTIRFTSADHLHSGDVMDGRIILSDTPVLQRFLQSVGIGR